MTSRTPKPARTLLVPTDPPLDSCVQMLVAVQAYKFCPGVADNKNTRRPVEHEGGSVDTTCTGFVKSAFEKSTFFDCVERSTNVWALTFAIAASNNNLKQPSVIQTLYRLLTPTQKVLNQLRI